MVSNLVADVIDTQINMGNRDSVTPVFELFAERVDAKLRVITATRQNIGHAFTVGHATNSVVGAGLGVDGVQVSIGGEGLGAEIVERVLCENGEFSEYLCDSLFTDSSTTTATIDTDGLSVTF